MELSSSHSVGGGKDSSPESLQETISPGICLFMGLSYRGLNALHFLGNLLDILVFV